MSWQTQSKIIETARELKVRGLTSGMSGNVSARSDEGFWITPSGVAYEGMQPFQLVFLPYEGERTPGSRKPSTEWQLHRDLYRERPDIAAIVHAHPTYCAALASTGRSIPAIHYMVAVAGGNDIRCAPYATFGTAELSQNALIALRDRKACLLANHGTVALGTSLNAALELTDEIEWLARTYCEVLKIGGGAPLSDEEMRRVLERFKDYGQK